MQEVIVAKVKVDTGEKDGRMWTKITITGDDGSEFTTFDHKAEEIGKGDWIELEPKVKGKYINFEKWTILEKALLSVNTDVPTSSQPPLQTFSPYQSEIEARAKNTALMQACELAKADKVDKGEILAWANKFLIWLQVGYKLGTGPETNVQQVEDLFSELRKTTENGTTVTAFFIPETDELLNWVATNMGWRDAKTARTWIVNVCKISEEKIEHDPAGCKEEIKALQGWT